MKNIIQDYLDHGYKLVKNQNGVLEFESDYEYNKKHIKKELAQKHPIFDKDSMGMKSKVIIKSMCGLCNARIINGKCEKCGRKIQEVSSKSHIPTLKEIREMQK